MAHVGIAVLVWGNIVCRHTPQLLLHFTMWMETRKTGQLLIAHVYLYIYIYINLCPVKGFSSGFFRLRLEPALRRFVSRTCKPANPFPLLVNVAVKHVPWLIDVFAHTHTHTFRSASKRDGLTYRLGTVFYMMLGDALCQLILMPLHFLGGSAEIQLG